jgi:murein DD-endopeptidase MepM/ murein hydrolase activator NlpD
MRALWILLLVLAGSIAGYMFTRFEREAPSIATRTDRIVFGKEHQHEFRVIDDGTGVERVHIWLESGEATIDLVDVTYPGTLFTGASLNIPRAIEVTLKPAELGVGDGPAQLVAESRDFSWLGNVSRIEIPLLIDTRAPRLSLLTGLTYARLGGTELAVYRVDEGTERDGVEVGEYFFRGYPHPEDPKRRVAFYALPPGVKSGERPRLVAEDRAGNSTTAGLNVEVIERSFPDDQIQLSESFMSTKVAELLGEDAPDDLLAAYLRINREMRAENAQTILEICTQSSADRLWTGSFLQMPGSQVGARFAEHRTYSFDGSKVDEQVHLGYDLSSTSQSEIPAANDGVVVYAGPLGIYGNTVIIDHGLGLFSLYGHLSEIAVEKGAPVARGESIGRTGQTGLAGGDHLHFSMLVDGIFVDPLEWFDAKWIEEHIDPKLALPASPTS